MTFQVAFCLFLTHSRTGIKISQDRSFTFVQGDPFLLNNVLFCMFLTHLHPDFLLQIFYLLFQLCNSVDHLTSEDQFLDKNSRLNKFGEVESSNRIRNMEVEPQRSIFSFIVLDNTLQDADMERNMLTIDGQKN